MKIDAVARKKSKRIVYLLAAILMLVRVDIWWWGKVMQPVLFGWLDVPMLYQIGVWFIGWMLVLYTANRIWTDEE